MDAVRPLGVDEGFMDVGPHDLGRVVLAHDYLNQCGGAERVVLELTQMWPHAPLYTSLYRPQSTYPGFEQCEIRTSFLDRLPVDGRFRALLPLYPAAFASLGPVEADLLICSSSGWAHGLRVAPGGRQVVYCYTPARWLYGEPYLGATSRMQALASPLLPALRHWDRKVARRADGYIAISAETQRRISRSYGIDAALVAPPVDLHSFHPSPRGERLLVVSRLLPYKRIDIVVEAATQAGLGLDVVGDGPLLDHLRRRAGPTVTFHGRVDDVELRELVQSCRALCLPGIEDFGIVPVEAQAAGKPVIAFRAGGALETVEDGFSGVFFDRYEVDAFLDAVRRCDALETNPDQIALRAGRFSRAAFRVRLLAALKKLVDAE